MVLVKIFVSAEAMLPLCLDLIIASLMLVALALVLACVLVDRRLVITIDLDLRILGLLRLMKVICTATQGCILL